MDSSRRFQVTFNLLYPDDSASYEVCTWGGERKAIVIAASRHDKVGKGHILEVDVHSLPGSQPKGSDLVDRMEW